MAECNNVIIRYHYTEGSTSPLQAEEREHPVLADRSTERVDESGEPSDGEGHDLLHSGRETQAVSPSPRLVKVHIHTCIHVGRDTFTQHKL